MKNTAHSQLSTPIGDIHILASEEGISVITFGDDADASLPESDITKKAASQLKNYFDGGKMEFDLPLSPEGTDFQKAVWNELIKIPYGKTSSYLDIALALGDRNATRAVGSANGSNPIAVVVPCHRVVGSDGKLTGYAGGLHRKSYLLELEHGGVQQSLF